MRLTSGLLALPLSVTVNAVYIWSSPGALPTTIPASCRAALAQNLTCDGGLITGQRLESGVLPDNATLTSYCTSGCLSSLQTFQKNVDTRCGNTLYQMYQNGSLQTGPSIADPLVWAYNTSCIRDKGQFCLPKIRNGSVSQCSNCFLSYGAAMLSNNYGRQRVQPDPFSSLLSSCGVPASSYTYSNPTSASTPTASAAQPSCTGSQYTAKSGDSCQSVASTNSIALDRLVADNSLPYDCSTLVAGTSLCLGPSCALKTVQANQTCSDIINQAGGTFSVVQLVSWNPTIHANCDNLDGMVGRSICVSPPGTSSYSEGSMSIAPSPTITPMFTGPFATGSVNSNPPMMTTTWFNTETNFSAPTTATVTYNSTAASLLAMYTTYCPVQPTDIAQGWDFYDLPDGCNSLLDAYCFPDLNKPPPTSTRFPAVCSPSYFESTTTSATGTAKPSPIEQDTTPSCKQYHQVLDGDTCGSLATHFGASLSQFYSWNPHVGSDCSALQLGYYVCVQA